MGVSSKRAKITKRLVDAERADPARERRIWDTEVKGFCLRVWPTGKKVYALKYSVGGAQRWLTIGTHGSPWTPELARDEANAKRVAVKDGVDPQAQRKATREAARRAPTVAQLIEKYLNDGPASRPNKRASSWETDRINLKRHVEPLLGKTRARDLRATDIIQMQADIIDGKTARDEKAEHGRGRSIVRGGRGVASRAMTSFAAALAWGVENGLLDHNPAADAAVRKARVKAQQRNRFLSEDEARALRVAVDELARAKRASRKQSEDDGPPERWINPDHADAVRLLMLTGARRDEILGLRWSEVNLGRAAILLSPDRHKGGSRTHTAKPIALPPEAVAILAARKRVGQFVFPDATGEKPLVSIKGTWAKIVTEATLPGFRLHDLRHSFASFAVADGASLYVVGRTLGHTKSTTTERYAHLRDDLAHATTVSVARRYAPAPADDASPAEVVPLPAKRKRKGR